MNIALIPVDSPYPNLALMKISAFHKAQGDTVEWYNGIDRYDKAYMSKIFTFTPDYSYYINADQVERGGTGYDIHKTLPPEIDRLQPDYALYPKIDRKTAYGFLTRGCPNRCKWCVVPKKEGNITPYMDVDEIAVDGRTNLILMDNNILASDYGLQQIEKIIRRKYRVDFNQGLDARLVTDDIARLLAKVKWIKRIRFGCDTPAQIAECERAINLLGKYGYSGEIFLYCILMEFRESFNRINYWRGRYKKVIPHAQPYRDLNNPHQVIPQWQKDLARWTDRKELYKSIEFKDFEPRKGFTCKQYFITL
ncbi:MAG TPA: radical SAM protein [Candidatus Bacteroides pullicola]|uniref:Radical SAM protein n=1 Tax=Candidatus Bacteroides pullicola TaxID=2838475 RepID=A0A9D2CLH4_9BACE|nr:radical SAM protein [Candidatus Bacteroides pullicola]